MDTEIKSKLEAIIREIEHVEKDIERYKKYKQETDKLTLNLLSNIYRELRRNNEKKETKNSMVVV
ncbi:MAG: hypothetical protein ACOYWZ_00070 [Bacillota bacterium]